MSFSIQQKSYRNGYIVISEGTRAVTIEVKGPINYGDELGDLIKMLVEVQSKRTTTRDI